MANKGLGSMDLSLAALIGGAPGGGGLSFGPEEVIGNTITVDAETTGFGAGTGIRVNPLRTLPLTSDYWVISAIEWFNGNAPVGEIIGGACSIDTFPPTATSLLTILGQCPPTTQVGASQTQKVPIIGSRLIPGGQDIYPFIHTKNNLSDIRYDLQGAVARFLTLGTPLTAIESLPVTSTGTWGVTTVEPHLLVYAKPVITA